MEANYFTILYWFLLYINMNPPRVYTCSQSWIPSHLPPRTIPLGHPSAAASSILYPASNLDWWFVSHMILYLFQCHSPKSSHPLPLPQSPKDCSIHQCLFCCLVYRVIVTIFLKSINMCSVSCIGEGNGNPLQCSCLENPRDGIAWRAAIYGVAQSRTRLSDWSDLIIDLQWFRNIAKWYMHIYFFIFR